MNNKTVWRILTYNQLWVNNSQEESKNDKNFARQFRDKRNCRD